MLWGASLKKRLQILNQEVFKVDLVQTHYIYNFNSQLCKWINWNKIIIYKYCFSFIFYIVLLLLLIKQEYTEQSI